MRNDEVLTRIGEERKRLNVRRKRKHFVWGIYYVDKLSVAKEQREDRKEERTGEEERL